MGSSRAATLAWRVVRFVVALGLVAWLVSRAGFGDLAAAEIRWGWLLAAAAGMPISVAVRVWSFGLVLNRERRILGWWDLCRITLVGAGAALFLPAGVADLAKARWGLTTHGSPEEIVVASVIDKLTSLVSVALLGLAAALAGDDLPMAVASGGLLIAGGVALLVRFDAGWHLLVRGLAGDRDVDSARVGRCAHVPAGRLGAVVAVSLLGWAVTYVVVLACVRAMGADATAADVFGIAPLVSVARLLPISIGGVGLGEVTMAAMLVRVGVAETTAAQAALAHLAVLVLLPGVLGLAILGAASRARA